MMNDQNLIQQYAQSGDAGAFEALVQKYLGMVAATASRHSENRQMAEEAVQNTFAILARKSQRLASHPTLGGWLHRTAMLEAGRLRRTERNRDKKMRELAEQQQDVGAEPELAAVDREEIDLALGKLRDADRDLLLLRFFEGLSFREIGQQIGKSEGAAQKQAERSLAKMRSMLERQKVALPGGLAIGLASQFSADANAASLAAAEVARNSLTASASLASPSLILETLMMISYPKLIAAGTVLLLLAWPVTSELKERRSLNQQLDDFDRLALATDGNSMAPANAIGANQNLNRSSGKPAKLTAITKGAEPPSVAALRKARSMGYSLGQLKRDDYLFSKKFPDGVPDGNSPELAEYVSGLDLLMKKLWGLAAGMEEMEPAGGSELDAENSAMMTAVMLATSLDLDAEYEKKFLPIMLEAMQRRDTEKLQIADRVDDLEGWQQRMNELTDDVYAQLAESLTADQLAEMEKIHGRDFLHSVSFLSINF